MEQKTNNFLLICVSIFILSIFTIILAGCSSAITAAQSSIDINAIKDILNNAVAPLSKQLGDLEKENARIKENIDNINNNTNKNIADYAISMTKISDVQQVQKALKDFQIKMQSEMSEAIKGITTDVSNVPSAVNEIRKVAGLFENTKQRGNIGEKQLEMIISSVLTQNMYEMQYTDESGLRPDCVIKTLNEMYFIDSKFPMDNYLKFINAAETEKSKYCKIFESDVKKMIDDLTKYKGITFMFIPSDRIMSDVQEYLPDVYVYGLKNKIILTCPSTL
jgi:DNA recombination protein RmuC